MGLDVEKVKDSDNPYKEVGKQLGELVKEKQIAYGDSFGKSGDVLRALYPNGIEPEQYDDALAITRIIDKLFRIANKKDAFDENPFGDITGYGLLSVVKGIEDELGESITDDLEDLDEE